jgi:hypothetical protein
MGKPIFFKQKFINQILEMKKVSTIRLWKRALVKEGEIVFINFKIPLKILSIKQITLDGITEEMAKQDGFESKEKLIEELLTIYSEKIKSNKLFFIEFDSPHIHTNK